MPLAPDSNAALALRKRKESASRAVTGWSGGNAAIAELEKLKHEAELLEELCTASFATKQPDAAAPNPGGGAGPENAGGQGAPNPP